ncbi:hypothetical protein E2C01_095162 [Portunus trituberculatus]|uniref:Uncharacterized protein n=1 Tax=Portunus trituberculatus TaxID=210409 RepID=A0A5B7JP45_PORTR|nr:hypothetical protein [Portunus trituberculatus]
MVTKLHLNFNGPVKSRPARWRWVRWVPVNFKGSTVSRVPDTSGSFDKFQRFQHKYRTTRVVTSDEKVCVCVCVCVYCFYLYFIYR